MKQAGRYFDDNFATLDLSDFEGTLAGDVGNQPSSATRNIHTMDPAKEAGKDRHRVYLACRQCRNRKIKCDGADPVCSTCIRRRSPRCDYDYEPRRRGPDRRPRVRTYRDSGPPPSLTPPRRSQKRASNDVVATPITPSTTQSPPYTAPGASAIISRIRLSNRSPTLLRRSFDSTRLHPSPSTSTLFHQGLVTGTSTQSFRWFSFNDVLPRRIFTIQGLIR
ncbi:hypothetical protein BS47DRAFT_1083471 [Hydnum rufescens UP504]|uniref:Zn(2)-C6 fungal-type domain-containing protein n=1 Tax=Hydnum rufescens UP504 TaxID=1448309 RepID=A0A9P6B923_9AGAM|nr:hypothetical protein BS47DRAFT_1083471 [Hydnum rufescens UP504]